MTSNELNEIIQAVDNINEDLDNQLTGDRYIIWSYCSIEICNPTARITIAGVTIWDSEDDEREWIEEASSYKVNEDGTGHIFESIPGHYEPMEKYLRRKINELISNISKVKL